MYVHGANLQQKENHQSKYTDRESRLYLAEIREKYDQWKEANNRIVGPGRNASEKDSAIISERTKILNEYKDFLDQQHYAEKFDSRSNLHSTVLEEFMYFMFKDLAEEFSESALIGKSHTFKDIFFAPASFEQMLEKPNSKIEKKDHDFAIGAKIDAALSVEGSEIEEEFIWDLPAIAVECKTYLDKTMLQDASTAAEQLKLRNPNAMYIVVAEWLKLTDEVNLAKFKIDQVYVLRKQKNTDREYRYLDGYVKNPIYEDVIKHLYETVRTYLCSPWEGGISFGLERGYLK